MPYLNCFIGHFPSLKLPERDQIPLSELSFPFRELMPSKRCRGPNILGWFGKMGWESFTSTENEKFTIHFGHSILSLLIG